MSYEVNHMPWSVGKHAKRSATLHIGSEDQLQYDNNQTLVTTSNTHGGTTLSYALGTDVSLQPVVSGTSNAQGLTRFIFEEVTLAQLNNNLEFHNANAHSLYPFGYKGATGGNFDNVRPGEDYLLVRPTRSTHMSAVHQGLT